MRVNVGELLADRRAVRVVAFSERIESPGEDTTLLDPVQGELVLTGTGRGVSLTGRVRTALSLVCGACLTQYRQPLEFAVDEEFGRSPVRAGASRGETELGPEDFVVPIGPDGMVDLTEVVRQHLVLAIPIAPRCREGCRGLCAQCGADLNLGPCTCPRA
ncbi:MAG TPA: DUF177 domain-containing protein [bacterium]|nr:DUF177 domain-containing protein [bacterium]